MSDLSKLTVAELRDEAALLGVELPPKAKKSEIVKLLSAGKTTDGGTAPKVEKAEPYAGLLPMRLHVKGAEFNNTLVELVRCAPAGEWSRKWLVRKGPQIVLTPKVAIRALRFKDMNPKLQQRAAFDFDDALALASKV